MYYLIRGTIFVALTVLVVVLLRKQKRVLTKLATVFLFLAVLLLVGLFPPENLFHTFDSPEDAFNYWYDGRIVCQNVISGQDSALVFGQEKVFDVQKSGEGWKLGRGYDLQIKSNAIVDGFFITVFRVRETDDAFVLVTAPQEFSVSDRLGSEFTRLSDHWESGFVAYCAPVSAAAESYAVIIDGAEYAVDLN